MSSFDFHAVKIAKSYCGIFINIIPTTNEKKTSLYLAENVEILLLSNLIVCEPDSTLVNKPPKLKHDRTELLYIRVV